MNSKNIGSLGEHIAIVALLELGLSVSRPLGDNDRYDIIVDKDNFLYKIQIKTATGTAESVKFYMTSSQAHRGGTRSKYSLEEVDYFILVDIATKLVFIVPNDGTRGSIILRYKPSQAGADNSNYIEDYLLTLDRL